MYFILFPQVPPSHSRAFAKAKLIHCITQPQITPGIRAFLILPLILVLYNWGSLQICSILRADNRSCWEGRALCQVWAADCLLQLGPDPEVCSWDPPSGAICCVGDKEGRLGSSSALRPAEHHQSFRDGRTKLKHSALVESEAGCPVGL